MSDSLENKIRKLKELRIELTNYIEVTILPNTSKKRINKIINDIYDLIDDITK